MTRLPAHLQANEQAALHEFIARLLQGGGGRVVGVWLFGSKARGDFEPDSDLDLLIVLEEADWIIRDRVHLLAARVSLDTMSSSTRISSAALVGPGWRASTLPSGSRCDATASL